MPKYQYACDKCGTIPKIPGGKVLATRKIGYYNSDTLSPGFHPETGEYIFFIVCSMKNKPAKPKCPNCNSNKGVNPNYTDLDLQCWVRGNGLVKDKAGAKRDMHRHKLKYEDPYASMRVSGEKDFLSDKFRRGGMDMSAKGNTDSIKLSQEARSIEFQKEVDSLNDIEKKIIVHIFDSGRNGVVTTTDLSKYSDDINKYLTKLNNKYIHYHPKKETWFPLAEGNRIYETILGI